MHAVMHHFVTEFDRAQRKRKAVEDAVSDAEKAFEELEEPARQWSWLTADEQ